MNIVDLPGVYGPCPLSDVTEPGPGVYIIRLKSGANTGGTVLAAVATGTVLYVGKAAEPLVRRVAKTHAATGKTHYSTLRRSLGPFSENG